MPKRMHMLKKIHMLCCLLILAALCAACSRRLPGVSTKSPGKIGIIHVVRKGETVWLISQMYRVSKDEIVRINNIEDAARITIGQRLFITGSPRMLKNNRKRYLQGDRPGNEPPPGTTNGSPVQKPPEQSSKPSPGKSDPKPSTPNTTSSYHSTKLKFTWPLKGEVKHRFGSTARKQSNGIEIEGSIGIAVHASEAGEVVYLGEITGYGFTLILVHQDDFYTLYAPVDKPALTLGEIAKREQTIARLGVSADKEKSRMLHFEIRKGKEPVDPLLYLK